MAKKKINTPTSPAHCFMRLDRQLRCSEAGCERVTDWAYAKQWDSDYLLSPLCFVHALAWDGNWPEEAELHEIIARFVVGMHDGQGQASVIAEIHPEDAPGFYLYTREDFLEEQDWSAWQELDPIKAWAVRYEPDASSEPLYFETVWDDFNSSFHLCSKDGTVQPPQMLEEAEDH